MLYIFKVNIINLFVCLNLAEVYSTATISDYSKDSSTNNQNNTKYLNDKPLKVIVNTDQYKSNDKFNIQLSAKSTLEKSAITANDSRNYTSYVAHSLDWETEERLLLNSLHKIKRANEEHKCLLDSLKVALIWWSHSNGTLYEKPLHGFNTQHQLDFSYRNISSDEATHKFISNSFPNISTVIFSLAHNKLTGVPFHTLQLMASGLKYLSLKGNRFIDKKLNDTDQNSPHCFLNEDDLIYFMNRNVTRLFAANKKKLAWATFPVMPSLIELDISDCHIEYIDKVAFRNLTNLKSLYMSHNRILNLPADTFLHTASLEVLDLSFANTYDSLMNNIMTSANLESFIKLYGINIEQYLFKYLPKLVYLDLSHTKLRSSSVVAFTHIGPALKYLSLCYTSFPVFGNGIFKKSSLVGLDLSGNANAAFSLTEDVFKSLSRSLTYLFFEKANLRDLSFLRPLRNLQFLALAGNSINHLSAAHFMGLKHLHILDLSSNHIGNWYSRVFNRNENLRILSLRDNNINVITSEMLKDFSILSYLSLGNNNFICDCVLRDLVDVSSINNQQAQCNGNLSQLYRSSIHIKSINLTEILQDSKLFFNTTLSFLNIPSIIASQNLYKLKRPFMNITLKDKPRIRFVLDALQNYASSNYCRHERITSFDSFSRKINSSTFKLQLLDYKEEQYWCYNETRRENLRGLNCQRASLVDNIEQELHMLTTYILASVGSLIFIALLAILVYLKRWHIYYYYSSLKSSALLSMVSKDKLNKFNNFCDQNPDKVYDIFISYCQSDRDWIVEELMPNVEKTSDISICLHERDFQIGVTILDNIISCMERSKVLMLIISSNFLLSHWCQFEMQLAQHHILDTKKDSLILILLEDIPRSKRPKHLHILMTVKTYIKWPGGKCKGNVHTEECKLFWKRLKRSLRSKVLDHSESKA